MKPKKQITIAGVRGYWLHTIKGNFVLKTEERGYVVLPSVGKIAHQFAYENEAVAFAKILAYGVPQSLIYKLVNCTIKNLKNEN